MNLRYRIAHHALLVVYRGLWRLEARGVDRIPRTGGGILAPNHVSFLDPPAAGLEVRRGVTYVARGTLADSRLLGAFLWWCRVIRIRRGEPDSAAIRATLQRLAQGDLVCIFPEGTRGRDGALGPFQEGAALLARRAGVPLIPVGIAGTESILPPGRLWPRRGRIRVVYGTPLDASAGTREAVNEELRRRVGLLLEEARSLPEL